MRAYLDEVTALARALVAIDSRSHLSNLPAAARLEAALGGFAVERIDYTDAAGVAKRALVAARGAGGVAFSGHLDTVPDTGWADDPWAASVADGRLHGLGSTDMKGPLAACVVAARALPADVPVALLITTDEETSKEGARQIVRRSALARAYAPRGILIAEPTMMQPVRGHRSSIAFTATATGAQAHSSTGQGRNANWDLIPFLADMRDLHARVRSAAPLQDAAYDPPYGDFNLVLDNHGAAVNVTVPRATARIKYRYSASIDPEIVAGAVRRAAARHGIVLDERRDGPPPELPPDHPFLRVCAEAAGAAPRTAPYGTDASELGALAPCVVMGPGDIAVAHAPGESVQLDALAAAVPVFIEVARRGARGG